MRQIEIRTADPKQGHSQRVMTVEEATKEHQILPGWLTAVEGEPVKSKAEFDQKITEASAITTIERPVEVDVVPQVAGG